MTESRALLILGPHRSGTSALARVVNLMGVELGEDLLPPKFDNPLGYWEHRAVFDLHERILARAGSSWDDYLPMPEGWQEREGIPALQRELADVLRREFSDASLWGVKDPRLGRVLPLWQSLLEEAGAEPHFLIMVRNPLEVARSLRKRNGFSHGKSLLLPLTDLLATIQETEGHKRAFVFFDALLADWRSTITGISGQLGLEWPREVAAVEAEIDTFLRPSERHHRHSLEELEQDTALPAWVFPLYEALEAASQGPGDALGPAFQQARDAWSRDASLFLDELATYRDQRVTLEEEQTRLERRIRHAEGELAKVQKHLTSILAQPLYKYTRPMRRTWRRLMRL